MARLILFVARAGMVDVREAIEGELAIAFEPSGLIDEFVAAIQLSRNPHILRACEPDR